MSHVVTIKAEITDLEALGEACTALGLELVLGQETFKWWGRHEGDFPVPAGFTVEDMGKCEHAIRIPLDSPVRQQHRMPYEVGVVARRDGRPGWQLMYDFVGRGFGMEQMAGKDCGKLVAEYGGVRAKQQAARLGYRFTEQRRQDGSLHKLTISR